MGWRTVVSQSACSSSGGVNSGRPTGQKKRCLVSGSVICIESQSSKVTRASRVTRTLDSLKSPITVPSWCST